MQLDHVVLAVADLARACEEFTEQTGCQPQLGGPHPGRGTHNALVAFAQGSYLEIIAPDPDQTASGNSLATAMGALDKPQLLHWAVGTEDLPRSRHQAQAQSLAPTAIFDAARVQPDGQALQWQLMGMGGHKLAGCMPFFIDWCGCPHPSTTTPVVGNLLELNVAVPEPEALAMLVGTLPGVKLQQGQPALSLRFSSANGELGYLTESPIGFAFGR